MQNTLTKTVILCRYAICLALLVVCAQISVPLPFTAVPVTLATFMIFVIGGLLGPKHGTLCLLVYILMGLVGLPVFAGLKSVSALVGPTGGYIVGYLPLVAITGLFNRKFSAPILHYVGMTIGLAACYLCGCIWYGYIMNVGFFTSLMLTAVPFIAADVFKMIVAYLVVSRLNRVFNKEKN